VTAVVSVHRMNATFDVCMFDFYALTDDIYKPHGRNPRNLVSIEILRIIPCDLVDLAYP